jgi:hypothetical protein
MRRAVLASLANLVVVVGCGSKNPPATGGSDGSGSAGSGSAASGSANAGSGSAGSNSSAAGSKKVKLPSETTAPPKPTKDKLDKAAFERIASAINFDSFTKQWSRVDDKSVDVKLKTKERSHMSVQIVAAHCFDCWKMDIATWREKTSALKNTVSAALRDLPTTEFTVDEIKVNGTTMIGTYQVGTNVGTEGEGHFTNAFVLYYNDGNNSVRIMTSFADDPLASVAAYKRVMPREHLQLVATRFMGLVTQTW